MRRMQELRGKRILTPEFPRTYRGRAVDPWFFARPGATLGKPALRNGYQSINSFHVGPDDGEDLAKQLREYEDQVALTDLTSLPKCRTFVRLLIDGMPSRPFTMKTLPPPRCEDDRSTRIRNVSRRRYGV